MGRTWPIEAVVKRVFTDGSMYDLAVKEVLIASPNSLRTTWYWPDNTKKSPPDENLLFYFQR